MSLLLAAVAASAALGAANSLKQTSAQIKELKRQAALKNLEGDIYEKNAAARASADAYNEDITRKQRDLELSRLRTATAQSGLSGGTLIDVQMRSEQEAEMDNLIERYNNHSAYMATMYEAQKARMEASQYLSNAKSLKKNRWINALFAGANGALGTAAAGGLFNATSTPVKDVTGTAGSGGNVTFTNASYKG